MWTVLAKNIEEILVNCYQPTEIMLQNLFFVETGYINTKNPEFVSQREMIFYRSLQEGLKEQKKQQQENKNKNTLWKFFNSSDDEKVEKKPRSIFETQGRVEQQKKNEIGMIKKLVQVYFGIVRRNLIDLVPKTIVSMLVNQSVSTVESQMIGLLYRSNDVNSLLERNKEVESKYLEQQNSLLTLKKCLQIIDDFEKKAF